MVSKGKNLVVEGINIPLYSNNEQDYISLTDMVKDSEDGARLVEKWLSNKNTIEFLGIWEQLNNPNFNSPEFGEIRNEAGTNRFYLFLMLIKKRTKSPLKTLETKHQKTI